MQTLLRRFVSPIEILSCQGAPVVAVDHSVWVQNWHYFEHEVLSQRSCLWGVADQEVDTALHHPGSVRLSRMDSSRQKDTLLCSRFGACRILIFRGDGDKLSPIASQSPTKRRPVEEALRRVVFFDSTQIILQVRVRVREAVGEELGVVVLLELVFIG